MPSLQALPPLDSPGISSPGSRRGPAFSAGFAALLLAACTAVGPDFEAPETPLPDAYREAAGAPATPEGGSEARPDWWALFDDPELTELVGRVRANNHEARAGLARLEQARALLGVARADRLPQLAFEPSWSRAQSSDAVEFLPGVTNGRTQSTTTVPVTLGWELDLFGRIRRATEAARADADAAAADLDALLLLLSTEAAESYLGIRALDREVEVVLRGVETRREGADLVRRRFELGATSELDVAQAEAQLAQAEADLAALERARAAAVHALAVLVGETASTFELEPAPLAGEPPVVPPGLPSELLRARPDVRRAERVLAAENARVGVATAAFYPSLSLTGNAGWQATDASDLFAPDARIWGIGPSVYLPLFQGGRNQANLARAKARYEEVVEAYQQSVLVALADVETALASRTLLEREAEAQQRAVDAAQRARELSTVRYDAGTVDYLTVLDAERTALDAERAAARLQGARFTNTVALLRALGGRW